MSLSPPVRRLSTSSVSRQEELINAYEAEEEWIINVLSRKLEKLREEKIDLENTLEAESESHVNRLSRQLTALRIAQQQQQGNNVNGDLVSRPETSNGTRSQTDPSAEAMLEAMRRENEQLRHRLVDTERDFIRISRLNEIYREELIGHRKRLGQPVDNLIGLSHADPYSQPTHHHQRSPSSFSSTSSPSTSVFHFPMHPPGAPSNGVPIPRPASQIHRPPQNALPSEINTPLSHSHSPSSSESPFLFSPMTTSTSTNPASYVSNHTNITSPPSSFSPALPFGTGPGPARGLSYPSVPPPSLSSSFGSPTVSYHMPHREREHSLSPVGPLSRRNSNAASASGRGNGRVAESGSLRGINASSRSQSQSRSRRESIERGARVAETGTLVPRSRTGSVTQGVGLPATREASDGDEAYGADGG